MYLSGLQILELRKYHKRRDRFDQIARSKLSLVVAGKWYKRLYPQVNQAFINAWQSDSNLLSRPATLNFINQNRIVQSAIRYFDAKNGRDVPVACFMESQSTLILRMYKWINSPLSSLILRAVIFVHMLLAFAEPYSNQKLRSNPLRPAVIVFQLFCILYESFEAVIRTIVYYYALRVEDSVSTITWKFKVSIILDITMFLIFFDWLFKISISFSGEYYFPIKAIMILLFISELRRICGAFFRTILRTRDVFIFYLMVMFLSSATAHLLFKDNVYFSQVSTDTFATFFRSFITMFVYISTGENLTQVIFPAVRESGYGLYLVIIRNLI